MYTSFNLHANKIKCLFFVLPPGREPTIIQFSTTIQQTNVNTDKTQYNNTKNPETPGLGIAPTQFSECKGAPFNMSLKLKKKISF